jgi:hypothetical protein
MRLVRPILALLFLFAAASARAATTYSDSDHGFSIDLPPEWYALDLSDVAFAVQNFSPDPNLRCFAGFRYSDTVTLCLSSTEYPRLATYSTVTFNQIQQIASELTQIDPAEFRTATRPAVTNIGIGAIRQIVCFSRPPGFVVDYQNEQLETRSHSVAFIGRDRLLTLHFFLRPADYPAQKDAIDSIAGSFRFHSGQAVAFDDGTHDPENWTAFGAYFLAALTLAGASYLAWYLFHRRPFGI